MTEEAPHKTTLSTQPMENTKPMFAIWQSIAGCGLPTVLSVKAEHDPSREINPDKANPESSAWSNSKQS